jgi:hypothetical protein
MSKSPVKGFCLSWLIILQRINKSKRKRIKIFKRARKSPLKAGYQGRGGLLLGDFAEMPADPIVLPGLGSML